MTSHHHRQLTVLVMVGVIGTGFLAPSYHNDGPTNMALNNTNSLIENHFGNNQDTLPAETISDLDEPQ